MPAHIRPASKAGSWYSDSPQFLHQQITDLLYEASLYASRPVSGGVVPHAGLSFSGPTAALTFKALRESAPKIKTLLLFGAVHTAYLDKPAVWADGDWECPLGNIKIDKPTAQELISNSCAENNPDPHYDDNALELQLPFIKTCFAEAQIVPIAVPPNDKAMTLGRDAGKLLCQKVESGEVGFIASTDLTHYGEAYGFAPVGMDNQCLDWAKKNDNRLLELAKSLHADKITDTANRDRSACGGGALAAACAFAHECGCSEGVVLQHTNSHEIMPKPVIDLFVGYASMVFVK